MREHDPDYPPDRRPLFPNNFTFPKVSSGSLHELELTYSRTSILPHDDALMPSRSNQTDEMMSSTGGRSIRHERRGRGAIPHVEFNYAESHRICLTELDPVEDRIQRNDGDDDDDDSSRDDADGEDEDEEDEDEEEEEEEHLAPTDSTTDIPVDEPIFPPEGTEPVIPPPLTNITIEARITVWP
ncbi:hypothetical protein Tco_1474781 [Tanacetum coccineum]